MKRYKRKPRKQLYYIKFIRHTSGQEYNAPYFKGNNVISGRWTHLKEEATLFKSKTAALIIINDLKLLISQRHDIGIISIKTGKEI